MTHAVTIRVRAGETTLFAIDADGGMVAPEHPSDRMTVVSALAQALVHLSGLPADEGGEDLAEPAPEAAQ